MKLYTKKICALSDLNRFQKENDALNDEIKRIQGELDQSKKDNRDLIGVNKGMWNSQEQANAHAGMLSNDNKKLLSLLSSERKSRIKLSEEIILLNFTINELKNKLEHTKQEVSSKEERMKTSLRFMMISKKIFQTQGIRSTLTK